MNYINFEIEKIYAGWFHVCLKAEGQEVHFSASDAWENDSPRAFLKMITDFLEAKTQNEYVVFDEEPGTYIVCISKQEEYTIQVLYSKLDEDEWEEDLKAYGSLSCKELARRVKMEELFRMENINFHCFAATVERSFEEYEKKHQRDKYEGNWMDFPMEELTILRGVLKKKQ